jgi:adhesin transport system membrane fusion protein
VSKFFLNNNDNERYFFRSCFEGSGLYLTVIVLSILVFFSWSSYAEIDRVVRVDGKIIPAGYSRQIQHLEGGIVSAIAT